MLNRDAAYVIEDAVARFGDERLRQMANTTRRYLREAREQLALPHLDTGNVLVQFQGLHRSARRERQDMSLSALTLVIIHLRAETHAEECAPARQAIARFVEEWSSPDEDDAPTGLSDRLEA